MDIEDLIEFIIRHEGFLTKPTDIGDGKITLGSGLTDPRWHKLYRQRGRWTDEDNRAAVRTEVENRIKWAETNIPNWNELPDSSKKALISYKYNYDFTARNSPRMYQALRERRWADAAKEINATSKNPVFKGGLEKRRGEEQDMFMRGFEEELEQDPTARAIIKGARATLGSTPLKPQIPFQNYIFSPSDLTKSITKHQTGGNIRHLPHKGDSWRNTNTGASGEVTGFVTQEYVGDDLNVYPYTAPVIKYEGDNNLYEGLPHMGELDGPTVLGRLRTPADDLGKVMAASLSLPFLAYGAGSLASGIASSIAANPQLWAQALQRTTAGMIGYEGVNEVNKLVNNGETWGQTASRVLGIPEWAGDLSNPGGFLEGPITNGGNKLLGFIDNRISKLFNSRQPMSIGQLNGIDGKITLDNIGSISPEELDAAHLDAVRRRDWDEAQRLRNLHRKYKTSKSVIVNEDQMPKQVFHQTREIFDTFGEPGKNSSGDILTPYGVFTKETSKDIGLGDIQMPLYVDVKNPLHVKDKKELLNLLPEDLRSDIIDVFDFFGELPPDIINPNDVAAIYRKPQLADIDGFYKEADSIKRRIKRFLDDNGYDGLIIDNDYAGTGLKYNDRNTDAIIALHPGQVKSSEGVTFYADSNGVRRVVPLSKRDDPTINDINWFGQPTPRRDTPSQQFVNPLETRLTRMQNMPHYPHEILSEDVTPENIKATLKRIAPGLNKRQLDQAAQELMDSRRGAYLNIGDDVGNTVSGVGVVDRESAIQYLKSRGIQNPTEADIQNVIAHEHGHSVRVSDEALAEISDFPEPDEFFTRAGQIFDEYGITETDIAESPIQFNEFMDMLQGYLDRGRLNNGITELKDYLEKLSPERRRKVMGHINRFAGTLPVLLAAREVLNNGEK